ncbi:type IV secretory system conjugative DNA transfer family protein [Egicoccus sp. AB-alg6-2]|uniref:type IV secretory system conjugative DNA transfer family protein n=1 Tax=Egicoccus sp. AB-alg6-2 TaxID=3242692 RepID=UPI00359DC41E
MNPIPPLPRSGKLTAGGPNALEIVWAMLALAAALTVLAVSTIAWTALHIEALFAGSRFEVGVLDMPAALVDLAANHADSRLADSVDVWWRPAAIAMLLTIATLAVAMRAGRAWFEWRSGWRHRQRHAERIGSRVWARRRDLGDLLAAPPAGNHDEPAAAGRLIIGSHQHHDVLVPARTSVMAIAPTRTGKTSRLVVPNLLRWDGPALVTSVKRDVYDLTVDRRTQLGPTYLFDPTGATGLDSIRWSPLLTSTTFADATRTAGWLADAAAVADNHDNAKFWETLATKLLAPMLFAAATTGRRMSDVSHWVDRGAFDDVAKILTQLEDEDARASWEAIRGLPNETRGSVFGTAMAIFRAFGSPRVKQATSATPGDIDNALSIGEMLKDNGTLYLVAPEYEQAELRPLFVALVQAVYRTAVELSANILQGAPLSPPLLMMLDEAGNIAPLKTLPTIASTGAGQGITLMTIWQDRAQIRAIYGEAERTVIANHTTTVWLPGTQDLDTLKLLSDLIGDQWVASSTISAAPDGGLSVSEGSERIDVAPPAFLRTLPHGNAVMLTGNHPPALITTHAYYQQPRWRRHVPTHVLEQHRRIHGPAAATTRQILDATNWSARLPAVTARPAADQTSPEAARPTGSEVGDTVLPTDGYSREIWFPGSEAVPDQLRLRPGAWREVRLPDRVANIVGHTHADLADVHIRRAVLPIWLEVGPATSIEQHLSFPQLHAEWPHLDLTDQLRACWEACLPQLAVDIRHAHPATGTAVA